MMVPLPPEHIPVYPSSEAQNPEEIERNMAKSVSEIGKRLAITEIEEGPFPNPRNTIIGRLEMKKTIGAREFGVAMKRIWKVADDLTISNMGEGLFIFEFGDELECNRVLIKQPWNFSDSLIILAKIEGFEKPNDISLNVVPFWIYIYGLLFNLMLKTMGVAIGNQLGKVLDCEGPPQGVIWVSA
ncbi:hypothetical protein ACS0TY_030640 [Phlomoides rotata]